MKRYKIFPTHDEHKGNATTWLFVGLGKIGRTNDLEWCDPMAPSSKYDPHATLWITPQPSALPNDVLQPFSLD